MTSFPRGSAASSSAENGARRCAPEEYLKSREVYRSERGFILVDAFRFVDHSARYPTPPNPPTPSQRTIKREEPGGEWQRGPHRFFFLSHFHSDHYTGIQRYWHTDTIYCSRPTAALTQAELGVSPACLFPMDMNETYVFSLQTGVCLACVPETPLHPRVQAMLNPSSSSNAYADNTEDMFAVRLVPANHCPGAAILLFVSPLFGTVVHTGDFRFNGSQQRWREGIQAPGRRTYVSLPHIQQQAVASTSSVIVDVPPLPPYEQFIEDDPALREVAEKETLRVLFLDNTFCGPPYKFPTQWEVTQTVVEVLRSLFCQAAGRQRGVAARSPQQKRPQKTCVRCAVLIGCYTIGKERVALAIRDAFSCAPSVLSTVPADATSASESVKDTVELNWRIHVSPRRYSMLTAMDFFPECFQPLQSPATAAGSSESENVAPQDEKAREIPFAKVEDVAVQLPVLLHSEVAQRAWAEAQARGRGGKQTQRERKEEKISEQAPTSEVRRCLTSDFSSQLSDSASTFASGESEDNTEYRLSVFLVSMANVGYQSVAALARDGDSASLLLEDNVRLNLAPYDNVLLVEPTGWCKRCSTRAINDKLTLLKVPYSEHCGFHEMIRFVQFINPATVVPTVSEDNFKQHEALFVEKAPRLRSRVSNVQPIARFFPAATTSQHSGATRIKPPTVDAKLSSGSQPGTISTSSGQPTVTGIRPNPRERRAGVALATTDASVPITQTVPQPLNGKNEPNTEATGALPSSIKREERKRAQGGDGSVAKEGAKPSATAQTLERLFQRVKVDDVRSKTHRVVSAAGRTGGVAFDIDGDDDCEVVRVVQSVVEISDDEE